MRRLAPLRRLKRRLGREVPVWGLRAPATVASDGVQQDVQLTEPADALLVQGWLVAAEAMVELDLRRRIAVGRLAEVVGERPLGRGETAADLDWFVRLLGVRRDAAQAGQTRDERQHALARGINAWIDSGAWRRDPRWAELRSRPRLWTAGDGPALALATARAGASVGHERLDRLSARWADLLGSGRQLADVPEGQGAELVPEELLARDRCRHEDRWRPVVGRREDIAVRGSPPLRAWVRFTPRGGLVSDLLDGALGLEAPVGPGLAWRWSGSRHVPGRGAASLWARDWLAPRAVRRTRLVPLKEGA